MSLLNNFLTTFKYCLSKKSEPVFNNYEKIITDFEELSPKFTSPYDLNGHQLYLSGPTSDGIFTCERMTPEEIVINYQEFLKYCSDIGVNPPPTPKYKWEYKSTACHSYDKFRFDITSPGRIVVKSTLPKNACASPWLYLSMNEGDFTNPYLFPIDKPSSPRNYYFEIDMYETFSESFQKLSFSGHYNTQQDRKMKTNSLYKKYNDEEFHYSEIVWDGKGNWKWLLDSIIVFENYIPQPENIYPYFSLTLGLFDVFPDNINSVTWKVEYVKFSNVIKI